MPHGSGKMNAQEREWQTESDVRTMIAYAELCKDPARKKRAVAKAKTQIADLEAATGEKGMEAYARQRGKKAA